MAHRVDVAVLDRSGQVQGLIDQPLKFEAVTRWMDVGVVSVDVRSSTPAAAALQRGARLAVMLDGNVFASGPMASKITTGSRGGDVIEATGPDDLCWLLWTLGYPAAPSINPNGAAAHNLTGPAEDVIYGYVNANAGPGAIAARRSVRLAPSGHHGSIVTESVRFDPILTVAKRVAIIDGFGLTCRWDPLTPGLPLFTVATSRDVRAQVQFSVARDTLGGYVVTDNAPSGTHILVGGSGDGVARLFAQVEDDDSAAQWYRVETFVDAGDTSDPATLTQRAQASLEQAGRTIDLKAAETVGQSFTDWQLGDIVTGITSDGIVGVYVIVELHLTGPPLRITPTLAEFAGYRTGELQAVQDRIDAERLRSLETRT